MRVIRRSLSWGSGRKVGYVPSLVRAQIMEAEAYYFPRGKLPPPYYSFYPRPEAEPEIMWVIWYDLTEKI